MKKVIFFSVGCLILFSFFTLCTAEETEDRELEAEVAKILEKDTSPPAKHLFAAGGSSGAIKLMDISIDSLFTAGGSTIRENEIEKLQAGGHDPKKNGFTVQNLELSLWLQFEFLLGAHAKHKF